MVQGKAGARLFTGLCAVALVVSIASAGNAATQETVLQRFPTRTNGVEPGGLTLGPAGALYGTTATYGPGKAGTVFRLTPPAAGHGAWTLDTLYAFQNSAAGAYPGGTLAIDKAGAIYGTTTAGGKTFTSKNQGQGVVFKLSPPAKPGGAWKESVLFSFTKNQAGAGQAGLVMDSQGALYGAAFGGGAKGFGTVFKLTPPAKTGAKWIITTLHAFQDKDGSSPNGLILDRDGALYGTTADDGSAALPQAGYGTVFKLTPPAKNGGPNWTFTTLYALSGSSADGAGPNSLVIGPRGAVYGVTSGAVRASYNYASTVFKLTPPTNGQTKWEKTILHTFDRKNDGGSGSGLVRSKTGSLFGTTYLGGTANVFGYGTVFRLDPPAQGHTAWVERVLYSFQEGKDGALPSGLVIDPAGTLYGATTSGGGGPCKFDFKGGFSVMGCGTVYQLTP
jgi:uncharacterized repeat protein (TIGR03803 family)